MRMRIDYVYSDDSNFPCIFNSLYVRSPRGISVAAEAKKSVDFCLQIPYNTSMKTIITKENDYE